MITKIRGGRHKGGGRMEGVYVRVAACVFMIVWPQHIVFIRLKALWYRRVWTTTVLKWCDRLWSHKDNSRSKTSHFIQSQWSHITPVLLQEQLENVCIWAYWHRCPHFYSRYSFTGFLRESTENWSSGIVDWTYLAKYSQNHRLSCCWIAALILTLHHTPTQLQITQSPYIL